MKIIIGIFIILAAFIFTFIICALNVTKDNIEKQNSKK